MNNISIVVFVPTEHAAAVREAIAKAGAGRIGNYIHCSFSTAGTGRFRPTAEAEPVIGSVGELNTVEEERIEVICPKDHVQAVLTAIRQVHPYEEPVIQLHLLLDEADI